jgi:folate-binding protein YgfZ
MVCDVVLSTEEARALVEGHHAIDVPHVIFRLEGPGAISCLQGLLTNDVTKMPTDGLIWGAFLTPKGMIISDAWVRRDGDAAWVLVPAKMGEEIRTLLARTIPPRLAKVTDVTGSTTLRWLVGADAAVPEGIGLVRPSGAAPFRALVMSPDAWAGVDGRLADSGWHPAPPQWSTAARILAGWPAVGHEIDEKTLPQEVRFDELGGVRYDKGCYTGQETVARLHFRGHANRVLRGLRWEGEVLPTAADLMLEGRPVGTVRTLARFGPHALALALVRREVEPGTEVMAGGMPATVIDLPEWGEALRAG